MTKCQTENEIVHRHPVSRKEHAVTYSVPAPYDYFVIDTYASIETEQRNNFDIVEKVEMVSEGKSFWYSYMYLIVTIYNEEKSK